MSPVTTVNCLLLAVFVSAAFDAFPQPLVRGHVRDAALVPIPFCNVFAERQGVIQGSTTSDDDGAFGLQLPDTGLYKLSITSVGYRKYSRDIRVGFKPFTLEITLSPDTVMLDQVIVHGKSPIQVKGDTLAYDASYFSKGDEVVLADLLRKLPGITVEDNGTVKFQGKEVSRIKIEDDDLFENHYAIVTKNLSADLVEEVEVLKHYSDNRLLKNLEDSDDVALNLKLKTDRKRPLFGDARAASDFRDRFDGQASLVSMLEDLKCYGLSNANSIGGDPTGDADELLSSSTFSRVAGGESTSEYMVPFSKPNISEFKKDRYYFNRSLFTSLAGVYRPGRKIKLALNGYGFKDKTDFRLVSLTDNYTPVDTVRFEDLSKSESNDWHGYIQASVDYVANAGLNIRYRMKAHSEDGRLDQQSDFNGNRVREQLMSQARRLDHHLTLTRRLSESAAITMDIRYLSDMRPQNYFIEGNVLGPYFAPSSLSDTLGQSSNLEVRSLGAELNYFRRFKAGKAGLRAGYVRMDQTVHSLLQSPPVELSLNSLGMTQHSSFVESHFAWQTRRVVITPEVAVRQLSTSLTDRHANPNLFVNPRLGVRWQCTPLSQAALLYSINQSTSSILQLTREELLTDFNQVSINDGGFRAFSSRILMATYELGNWMSGMSTVITAFHKEMDAAYLVNTDIEPNYVVSTMNKVADRKLSSVVVMFDKYFKSMRSNLKIAWNYNRSTFELSVEGLTTPTVSNAHHLDISLRTALTGPFNLHAGHVLETSVTRSGLMDASNLRSMFYVDGYVNGFASRLHLTLHGERYELLSVAGNPVFHFIDFSARFSASDSKRLIFTLKGRNLLDETIFAQRNVSNQSVTVTANQLIPRYILAGIEFRF